MVLNMVNSCAAYNCAERYRKGGVAFHSFPTSQDLRDKWTKALRRSNFTPNHYSKLCAKHFTPDCYETAPWSFMKRLKEGAVPTIFEFSQKRKYQKKSLDDSSERSQDRECGTMSQNFADVPISHSPSRRKQLIVERKDFNASDADSSGNKSVKFLSKPSQDMVETEKFVSLPSKRCRKKKTFSSDFVSEDWSSRRKGRANKTGKKDVETKDLGVEVTKLGAVKSSEVKILETEKKLAVQNASSAIFSERSSDDVRESTNVGFKVVEKIINNQAVDVSDEITLKTVSCTMPDESNLTENCTEFNQVTTKNKGKNILVESISSKDIFTEKSTVRIKDASKDKNGLEMEDFSTASNNVSNVSEEIRSDAVSESIFAASALQDISCSQDHIAVSDTNITSDAEVAVAESSKSVANQKVASVFKLNLEEEEAMLQRCVQLGEAAKREKLVRLKKFIGGGDRESVGRNQIMISSSSSGDESEKNSRRKSYFGDFKQEDLVSPEKAAKCLKVAQKVIKEKTLKIKVLRQRERRLMQKVEELENVIFHLVEKRMNPEEASTVLIVLKEND